MQRCTKCPRYLLLNVLLNFINKSRQTMSRKVLQVTSSGGRNSLPKSIRPAIRNLTINLYQPLKLANEEKSRENLSEIKETKKV